MESLIHKEADIMLEKAGIRKFYDFYNRWKDFVNNAPVFEVRWDMFPESSKPETIIMRWRPENNPVHFDDGVLVPDKKTITVLTNIELIIKRKSDLDNMATYLDTKLQVTNIWITYKLQEDKFIPTLISWDWTHYYLFEYCLSNDRDIEVPPWFFDFLKHVFQVKVYQTGTNIEQSTSNFDPDELVEAVVEFYEQNKDKTIIYGNYDDFNVWMLLDDITYLNFLEGIARFKTITKLSTNAVSSIQAEATWHEQITANLIESGKKLEPVTYTFLKDTYSIKKWPATIIEGVNLASILRELYFGR